MSQWQRIEFQAGAQLVQCELFGPGQERPHTTLKGKSAMRKKVIHGTTAGYTGTAEYLFEFCTSKMGINSHEQLISPEAAQNALNDGSHECVVEIPCAFPDGQIQYRSGRITKAVERATFSMRFRLSPKRQ